MRFPVLKSVIRKILGKIVSFMFRSFMKVLEILYGVEGISIPIMFMPMHLIPDFLRNYGANIGQNVRFCSPIIIHNANIRRPYYTNLTVGNNCYLGRGLFLDLKDKVIIHDNVTISHFVMIITHMDVGDSPLKDIEYRPSQASVTIHKGAYIGSGVIILPGIEIGECAVVGAGAVVTKNVKPYEVVAGVPARKLRDIKHTIGSE